MAVSDDIIFRSKNAIDSVLTKCVLSLYVHPLLLLVKSFSIMTVAAIADMGRLTRETNAVAKTNFMFLYC
eukprot:scaffold1605_cov158-Amphora_coffeaeformis.AAC.6